MDKQTLDKQALETENQNYSDTKGVSGNNKDDGFLPAFRDNTSGRIEMAKLADGTPAPMHVISGLPTSWAEELDGEGNISALKSSVVSGFVKQGVFFTREEAIEACKNT